jgi:mRNA degradation ribonuclease J1/J2
MEIHIGGHGTIWEIEKILRAAKADYVMPVYANHYFSG